MAIAYNTSIVRNGLVLYLDAANRRSYSGTGTAWNDLSGNGNNGTLVNGPTYNSDNMGNIALDGVDDYVNVSNPQSLNPGTNSFSINAWVKQNDTGYNGIVEARGASLHGILLLLNYTVAGQLTLFVNTTTDGSQNVYLSTVSTFGDVGVWMNICAVVNRSTEQIDFYKNGVKQGSSVSITSGGSVDPGGEYKYWIGGDLGGPESNASFSVIQQYNRVLSVTEIQQNFNALRGRYNV
jgi:hypothetical protein